jgi:dTDP-4-dehydrorhamnose 3,5-epimerase
MINTGPILLVEPKRFTDERGWFSETFSEARWRTLGIAIRFVQDNQSFSRRLGTVRGLHCQLPPHAQDKLVRCVSGRVFDVILDRRRDAPTYGRWLSVELSAAGGEQLFIPRGFAHGVVSLTEDAEVFYKVSDIYAPDCDAGIRWNDPELAIPWPLPPAGPVLSARDSRLPRLAAFDSPFPYDGRPLALTRLSV